MQYWRMYTGRRTTFLKEKRGLCLKDSIDKIGMYVDKQCVMPHMKGDMYK